MVQAPLTVQRCLMKAYVIGLALALLIIPAAASQEADNTSILAALFTPVEARQEPQETVSRLYPNQPPEQRRVAVLVAQRAKATLGREWQETAVIIAFKESRFNCKATGPLAKGSRAMGVMQVMPGTARGLGFNPRNLHDCTYGIDAGLEHMRRCASAGATTQKQMIRCHQTGWVQKKNPATRDRVSKGVSNRSN